MDKPSHLPVQGKGVVRSSQGAHHGEVNPSLIGTLLGVGIPLAAKALGSFF
ncbi:MAG: hypothetical protein AAFQ98_05800 [Bacteroidota bacterium]